MPVTYKKIASVTVGAGGQASIDIQNIPSTYDDLLIKISGRAESGAEVAEGIFWRFNNNTTSADYDFRRLYGTGSSAASNTATGANADIATNGNNTTASTFGNLEAYIPNYKGSTNKSFSVDTVVENNATSAFTSFVAGLWKKTDAINRITLTLGSGSDWAQHSTVVLYGISKS